MRYVIESKTRNGKELLEGLGKDNDNFELITSYEPIEKLQKEVEKVGLALQDFKKSGINMEVFEYYMRGRGISSTKLNLVMGEIKGFFEYFGIKI